MSEQGWRRFLAAEGVADWVVLHGGAMAVFRVPSLAEAAQLAEAVAQISGLDGALMTLADGQLAVRLTRGVFQLEERHVEVAQAVSAVAREHGAGSSWSTSTAPEDLGAPIASVARKGKGCARSSSWPLRPRGRGDRRGSGPSA